jgi:hypothetical protein
MDKPPLEDLLYKYNWWIGLSTIAVAVGILGEYVVHFIFEKGKKSLLHIVISIAFAVLVIGGVVGEYIFGSKLSAVSSELQQNSDAEVAKLNGQAGEARRAAANAEEQASYAGEGTAKALAQAAAANERATKLEVEAAQQRERAARAEHDLLELQQRVRWRELTADQRKSLVDALRRSSVKGLVTLNCVLGDGEALSFAKQIHDILGEAGWPATAVDQRVYQQNPIGIAIVVNDVAKAPPHAGPLQNAFVTVGVPLVANPSFPEGSVTIVVGNKPQ